MFLKLDDWSFVEMYNHHGPLQIPNNFKFKLIYLLPLLPQDGASLCSSSWHYAFVSPYERSLMVVFDEACEGLFK
jgi:hypothetical protein